MHEGASAVRVSWSWWPLPSHRKGSHPGTPSWRSPSSTAGPCVPVTVKSALLTSSSICRFDHVDLEGRHAHLIGPGGGGVAVDVELQQAATHVDLQGRVRAGRHLHLRPAQAGHGGEARAAGRGVAIDDLPGADEHVGVLVVVVTAATAGKRQAQRARRLSTTWLDAYSSRPSRRVLIPSHRPACHQPRRVASLHSTKRPLLGTNAQSGQSDSGSGAGSRAAASSSPPPARRTPTPPHPPPPRRAPRWRRSPAGPARRGRRSRRAPPRPPSCPCPAPAAGPPARRRGSSARCRSAAAARAGG